MTRGASLPTGQRRDTFCILVLILVGLAARIFYFRFTIGSDDQRWVLAARQLFGDRPLDLHSEYYARVVWRLVLRSCGVFWPVSLESAVPLMFLLFLVTTFALARVTRTCFGTGAALIAVGLFVTHPVNVLYDTRTLPDGLGVAMLTIGFLLFVSHLQSERLVPLAGAGLMIGLTVSVKEYFVLFGVPCIAVLAFRERTATSWRPIATFCLAIAVAGAVDVALHAIDAEPLAHWRAQAAYGDRLLARQSEPAATDLRSAAALAVERSLYVRVLFFERPGTGLLLLWGVLVVGAKARRDAAAAVVLGAVAMFLAFLSLAPAKLRPLILVEIQERYLMVVLPFAAIAAGAGVMSVLRVLSVLERHLAVAGLVVVFCVNLIVADNAWDTYRTVEFIGIRDLLRAAPNRRIAEVALPEHYRTVTPDRYHSYGPKLVFLKFTGEDNAERMRHYLRERRDRAAFVPRGDSEDWRPHPRDDVGVTRATATAALVEALSDGNFAVEEIRAPYTAWRSWLAFAQVSTRGRTVGWLYRLRE